MTARAYLDKMMASALHTVQKMPDPERFEVIYCGRGPFPNDDPRCGDLEATVFVEGGALRVVRA